MIRSEARFRSHVWLLAIIGSCALACNNQVEVGSNTGGSDNTGEAAGQGGAPPMDATNDVVNPCPGAACPGEPVWSSASTRFSLHISGGLPRGGFGDPCWMPNDDYGYTRSTRVLTRNVCITTPGQFDAVVVSTAFADRLLSRLERLTTVSQGSCGVDSPDSRLTIVEADVGSRTYNGDFYSGCPADVLAPPWVGTGDLLSLWSELASAFGPDGGSTPLDAGSD